MGNGVPFVGFGGAEFADLAGAEEVREVGEDENRVEVDEESHDGNLADQTTLVLGDCFVVLEDGDVADEDGVDLREDLRGDGDEHCWHETHDVLWVALLVKVRFKDK